MPTTLHAEKLLDSSPDALIAISSEGEVLSWSTGAEQSFGFSSEDAVGRTLDELLHPPGLFAVAQRPVIEALLAQSGV